jgi:predicted short-subunit dehydrogenase-like oxidoreductase (DUF2520 family)
MRELERDLPDRGGPSTAVASLPAIAVIGTGRAGQAIARAAGAAGLDVALAGRADADAACHRAEVALLCVPDAEIEAATAAAASAVPPLRFVGHVSGAVGLDALAMAGRRGADTFSLHPLQTLLGEEAGLDGAACAVSGSTDAAVELAVELGCRLGMRPFEVPESRRAAYHAAASMASNFLIALEESATALLDAAGVENPRELLAPLVERSAANWSARGAEALTGPIARGDEQTVERHRAAIRELAPELLASYDALADRARAVAEGASR